MPVVKVPRSVKEWLCIDRAYENGNFKIEPMTGEAMYDQSYVFEDINYVNKDTSKKDSTLLELMTLLKSLDGPFKITLANEQRDLDSFVNEIFNPINGQEYPVIEKGIGKWINQKIDEGTRDIRKTMILTVTCRAHTLEEAEAYFATIDTTLSNIFRNLRSRIYKMSAEERMVLLSRMLRAGEECLPPARISPDDSGWKNQILPASIQSDTDYMVINNKQYVSVLVGTAFGQSLSEDKVIHSLSDVLFPTYITIDMQRVPKNVIHDRLENAHANNERVIAQERTRNYNNKQFGATTSYSLTKKKTSLEDDMDQLDENDEEGVFLGLLVLVYADSLEELTQRVDILKQKAKGSSYELEHASRVYRYRFMDQILIYAQRPDAVACAIMNIWNSKMGCWIKKGNRGIALIDESNSRKLKYVWDVASVVPKMGGHLPRLWIRKPYHTETIQNRLLKVYGLQPQTDKYDTKKPSIEHTMDYLVEYLADEYAADIAQEKYSSDNSPLSELDEEKYKMDEYRRNVRFFFRYGLNRMIKDRMGLSTGGFPDYDMSFIKDMSESDFCELSSRMTDAAQQALREVGIAVLTYDRVHGIDRDPNVDYNALKRKSAEREDKTYGTRIHQSRGLRDTEPYTEQGTTGAADEIRTYAQDMAQKELQGEVRYDADVRGTSGTLPKGTEESTGRDGQNRAADEKTGRSDRTAEDAGPAEMDTNDEQHPEQGRGNSEGYSDLHFIENEIVPESGTDEDEYVPESGTGLYFMPELPTEDEQRIKVEKYGYLNPRKADYIPHDYIRQVMLRGTGFEGVVGQNKYGVYESAYLW